MIDRLFLATLTFCLLIAGSLAMGSAMLGIDTTQAKPVRVVQLEPVVITAKRLPAASAVAVTERVEPATQRAQ
jgi:hypothetical protein